MAGTEAPGGIVTIKRPLRKPAMVIFGNFQNPADTLAIGGAMRSVCRPARTPTAISF